MERITPRPKLEIRDLELVLALAASGSTTSAASTLHLTQSAISRALCLAEEKVGVKLFERTRHGLSPTPSGELLISRAGAILGELAQIEQELGATSTIAPRRVRLVCECYTAYRWLPSTIAELRKKLPDLQVTLAIEHTNAPMDALCAGDIDIALLTTAELPNTRNRREPLVERPLFSDEVVFVVASSHPLASKKSLTPADLCTFPMITSYTPVAEQRWFARKIFGRAKPKVEMLRFPLTEAIIDATRAGMGIAVMSEWIAGNYLERGELVLKRLTSGPLRRPWRIAYRKEVAAAAEQIIGALAGGASGHGCRA